MGRPTHLALTLVAALALAGCAPSIPDRAADPGSTSAPTPPATQETAPATEQTAPQRLAPDGRPFVVTEKATFTDPWALEFLPGTDWLAITERSGRLLLRDQTAGTLVEVQGVPQVVAEGQGGLGDIVAGPTFTTDRTVYLSWVEAGSEGTGAVVGRARLDIGEGSARLIDLAVIWRQTPKTSGAGHFSHRLAFSPDGQFLFVSSGDRQKRQPAQDLGNTLGTIVRLTPDGAPAPGNPFADRGSPSDEIWSYGHRNVLGLEFDAEGRLWASEMGPRGGDEVNLIEPGKNYGWPKASNGSHYSGGKIPDHRDGDGFEAPKVWWTPSVSPGSLLAYSGTAFPHWQGDLLLGALSGQALIRVQVSGTDAVKADHWPMGERIRAVEQAPDGTIWLAEDLPGGRLLQLTPPEG